MNDRRQRLASLLCLVGLSAAGPIFAQSVRSVELSTLTGVQVQAYTLNTGERKVLEQRLPLFSFQINDSLYSANDASAKADGDTVRFSYRRGVVGRVFAEKSLARGWKATIIFENRGMDTLQISNIVPFGESEHQVYITAAGPSTYIHRLSRSKLFRPGYGSVGVLLPDNAWELGFGDVEVSADRFLCAITRRTNASQADVRRFRTQVHPGGSVEYVMYLDDHQGDWHDGLNLMFRQRWLYDLDTFDSALFERKDLAWVRRTYLSLLQFAWDKTYYDPIRGKYEFDQTITAKDKLLGGFDIYMIWPTWPRLGLDQRNQFDLYRDLPGGLKELHRQSEVMHRKGAKYFISYNPWDESTRHEDHLRGIEDLLRATDADGVVLDTRGESSREFQETADRVKPGIVMYSEGMAVVKDMPGIVAGRVHDAIYLPPPLNLNKFIKPDFAIFRVTQVTEGKIHREAAVAFFNGYGTELNVMRSGRPDWIDEELRYLGRTTKILRENSSAFLDLHWTPLLPTLVDSAWVNKWSAASKTLYTILSLRPEGVSGPLFEVHPVEGFHYVSLWNHEEIDTVNVSGRTFIPATVDGFSRSWLGTREEGNVDCIALLPRVLSVKWWQDSLRFSASRGTKVIVWAGMPSYDTRSAEFPAATCTISLREHLGMHEEKFVVQLFDGTELLDERVVVVPLATPRLITAVERTAPVQKVPDGMVDIPGGVYTFRMSDTQVPNPVVPYPEYSKPRLVPMKRFFMDRYPVTNEQFKAFLEASAYKPKDPTNFLKHWVNEKIPKGKEKHPVIFVSLEDARAYARWAGKRLPTGIEWQYAAQGTDGRKYPWGNEFDSTRCNNALNTTTPVDAYPAGRSPSGVMDMIGNVWQMTNDVYDNGSYYYGTLRGGSNYYPRSSEWYVTGGPWPVDQHQMLLMVSPSFDRSETVGFRCVKDEE